MNVPAGPARGAGERPLRRDAERNRQRILRGALECFADRGLAVSLDDIARHSEVGVGTVYRRFPNKQVLIDTLFEEHLEECARALARGIEHSDAWTGFTQALESILTAQLNNRGLMELMIRGMEAGDCTERGRGRLIALTEQLIDRAQAQGTLRADVRHTDIPLIQLMLASLIDASRDVDPEVWRRYLALTLDGLRARRDEPTALPAPAPEIDVLERTMNQWRPPGCPTRSARPTSGG